MKSSVVKHSIVIEKHKTSISLEDAFWSHLKDIAHSRHATLSELVAHIDQNRKHGNLSSAIRLFVLGDVLSVRVARAKSGFTNSAPPNDVSWSGT